MATQYDIDGLVNELEVDFETIVGLYGSYFEEMQDEVSDMEKYLGKKDWYMLQRVVHNIKGVSANLNIHDVFAKAEEFDILLKNNRIDDADIYVYKIKEMIETAEKSIREFFFIKGLSL